jgi:hypothetical protein
LKTEARLQTILDPSARASSEWDALAIRMARDGFVVAPGAVGDDRLELIRRLADVTPLTQEADYPGSDKDVGYPGGELIELFRTQPPARPLLERLLGEPVFLVAWQRVGLPRSGGAPWHQDWEREFWPPAVNLALYLDDVTPDNGPTLVAPGTHMLPHPVFDDRAQPREEMVLGPAGTVALFYPTVWHRGSANKTDHPRRALFCYYRSADAIRVRRSPDPDPETGWVLGDPGEPDPHWILE